MRLATTMPMIDFFILFIDIIMAKRGSEMPSPLAKKQVFIQTSLHKFLNSASDS